VALYFATSTQIYVRPPSGGWPQLEQGNEHIFKLDYAIKP